MRFLHLPLARSLKARSVRSIALLLALICALVIGMLPAAADIGDLDQQYTLSQASTQQQYAQLNHTFTDNMTVVVCVVLSNPCQFVGGVDVTFSAPTSGASGTFPGGATSVTVTGGGAPAFTANGIAGSYAVKVTANEPTPANAVPTFFFFTNTSVDPTLQAVSISDARDGPGVTESAQTGTVFAENLVVAVFNATAFPSYAAGVTVTFTAPDTGPSGTFSNGLTSITTTTGSTGLASAGPFTANNGVGPYFVEAVVSGAVTATGDDLTQPFSMVNSGTAVTGVPTIMSAAAGFPQQVGVLSVYPTDVQIAVLDGSGNLIGGASVTFTTPSTGPTATFAGGSHTYTTATGGTGLATGGQLTSNEIAGQFPVTITVSKGGTTIESAFSLINGRVLTTTAVSFNPSGNSVYGQTFNAVATVLPVAGTYVPTGKVAFKRNGTLITGCESVTPSGGVATCAQSSGNDESTWLTPATYTYSASYLGDVASQPSTSPNVSHIVNKAGTTTVLTTSQPAFVLFGQNVTFTATITVTAPGRGLVIPQVTFTSNDSTPLNSGNPVTLVNGVGQVSTSALTTGTHIITATYPGNTNFNSSIGTVSQNVYTVPEVTLDPIDMTVLIGNTATFTTDATGVPNPTVQWQVSTDGGGSFTNIAGATSKTLSFTPTVGQDQTRYKAVFTNAAGTDTSAAAVLTVRQPPSITSASSVMLTVGTAATFTVTADGYLPPTITMTGGVLPANLTFADGVISGTPADGTGGVYALQFTATNGTDPAATQNFTLTVVEPPTITSADTTTFAAGLFNTFTITADGNPASTITSPSTLPAGVTLSSSGVLSGTPTETGTFVLEITAANGNAPDATQTFTLIVTLADQTPLNLSVTPDNGIKGDKLVIALTGGSGTGAVNYDIGASTACALGTGGDDGKLLITDGVGTCSLTASKAASGFYKSANSNTVDITVSKAATTLETSNVTVTFGDAADLSATLKSNGTPVASKTVTFAVNGGAATTATTDGSGVAALTGVSLSGINAGTYADGIVVNFAGDADYQNSTAMADLTIDKAAGSVSINNIPSPAYIGSTFTPAYTVSGNGATSAISLSLGICTVDAGEVTFLAEGTCDLQASAAAGDNHLAATGATQSFAVTPPPVLGLSASSSGYNGWITATLSEFAPTTTVTLSWDGGSTLGTATTDADGAASISFRTPLDVFGPHTVTASDGAGTASATLSITTRIKLTAYSGPSGLVIRVYVYGYAAGDHVPVRFYSATGKSAKVLVTLLVADNGRATSLITIPNTTVGGPRLVTATTSGRTAATTFTVIVPHLAEDPSPTPTQTPTATATPAATATVEPTATATLEATATVVATETAVPTATATEEATETPVINDTPTEIPTDTATPLPNASPVAVAGDDQTLTDTDADGQEAVTLDGSGSTDPEGGVLTYQWNESDTVLSTDAAPQLSLAVGTHTLVLTVTDDAGNSATDEIEVIVNAPPTDQPTETPGS